MTEQQALKDSYIAGALSQLEVVADAYGAGRRDTGDRIIALLEEPEFQAVMDQVIVWASRPQSRPYLRALSEAIDMARGTPDV